MKKGLLKAIFAVKKTLRPNFSRVIECDKPNGTNFRGQTSNLKVTLEVIISFL